MLEASERLVRELDRRRRVPTLADIAQASPPGGTETSALVRAVDSEASEQRDGLRVAPW